MPDSIREFQRRLNLFNSPEISARNGRERNLKDAAENTGNHQVSGDVRYTPGSTQQYQYQ